MDYIPSTEANISPFLTTITPTEYGSITQAVAAGGITPLQIATAYNIPASTGANVKVGIISLGGGWSASDFNKSMGNLGLSITSANITTVLVDGATGTFTGGVYDGENTLDLYCVASMVPQANIVIYIGQVSGGDFGLGVTWYTNPSTATSLNAVNGLANVISRAVSENCDVITVSYGYPEIYQQAGIKYYCGDFVSGALSNAAAKGITVCVSSGDYGSTDTIYSTQITTAEYPATNANAVAVGGTTINLTASNTRVAGGETVVNNPTGPTGWPAGWGSGGGISSFIPVPSWQTGLTANLYFASNGYSHVSTITGRGVPDIAAPMNGTSYGGAGVNAYAMWFNGSVQEYGGTSASAPVMAGMFARFISLTGRRPIPNAMHQILYGNLNAYYDITTGNNDTVTTLAGYAASSNWDPVTGVGVPWGNVVYQMVSSGGTTVKTAANTWSYLANVKVKTAPTTWSNVKAIWTKTINGWSQTF